MNTSPRRNRWSRMFKKAAPLWVMAAALGVTACGAEGGVDPDAPVTAGDEPGSPDDIDGTSGAGGSAVASGGNGGDGTAVPENPNAQLGEVVATYFAEWSIYGRDFHVADIAADKLTHVLYGFIPICGPNDALKAANPSGHLILQQQCADKPDYSVTIHDKYAALEKSYPGDEWDDPIRGNFGQLMKMKAAHPDVKVLPSVGGWTLSDPFFSMAGNDANRRVFVDSVISFLKKYEIFD
ncbi:MAG: glycosyl hydrolase family 18 protein, partial [Polyangiaceae bacterium]